MFWLELSFLHASHCTYYWHKLCIATNERGAAWWNSRRWTEMVMDTGWRILCQERLPHTVFFGILPRLKLLAIWKAKAEHKWRFFAWTLLHKKILTWTICWREDGRMIRTAGCAVASLKHRHICAKTVSSQNKFGNYWSSDYSFQKFGQ